MACLVKIFMAVWLIAGFYFIGKSQDKNEDIIEQRLGQATDLIGQTGDSLRVLLAEMSEGAVLTDLQKAKIDQIRLKLNVLEDMLKVLSPAELIPTDTNRFPGSLMNDAQRLITQSRPDEGIPLIMKFLDRVDSQSDSAIYARIYLAEAYRQKQEHAKGIEIIYDIPDNSNISIENRAFAFNRMAALQNENRNFERNKTDSVRKYSRLCIGISQEHNLTEYLALSQNEPGSNYLSQNMPDSALPLFYEAANNFLSINKFPQAINTYLNLARLYFRTGQMEESRQILLKALDLGNVEENRNLFKTVYYYLVVK
jgi:tetratricopeptide (TPR) repeat protein